MTAPEPTSCQRCEGSHVEAMNWNGRTFIPVLCRDCTCAVCGRNTDTPPECGSCAAEEEASWKRSADV